MPFYRRPEGQIDRREQVWDNLSKFRTPTYSRTRLGAGPKFGSGHKNLRAARAAAISAVPLSSPSTGMSSRSAYTAITPDSKFPTPYSPFPSDLNHSSSRLQSEEHDASSLSVEEEGSTPPRIHIWLASSKDDPSRAEEYRLRVCSLLPHKLLWISWWKSNTIDL